MELSEIKTNEAILEIVHPVTDELLGINISLRPLDDDVMKKLSRKINDEKIALGKRGKTFDAKKIEENTRLILFTAMTGWDWHKPIIEPATDEKPAVYGTQATFHGNSPPFNQETVYKVFDELPWFQSQVEEKLGDIKSFFPV